jgi:hypothetical protein
MRQEFLNIIHQLKNNKYYAISIIDDTTMNKILSTSLGSTLISNYGSVENYFEQLKNSGVTSFTITEYKKNGSGWKNLGNVVRNLTFSDKNTAVNPVQVYTPPAVQISPLNGANGQQVVGLGFYEAANLMASSQDKVRLEEENKYLKRNNEELKKLVDELKEERLKSQYDTAGKANQNEMILGLVQNLPAILNGFKSAAPAPALNAPAPQQNVSEVKAEMLQYLSQPTISDQLIHFLYSVADRTTKDIEFAEQVDKLLNTPKQA